MHTTTTDPDEECFASDSHEEEKSDDPISLPKDSEVEGFSNEPVIQLAETLETKVPEQDKASASNLASRVAETPHTYSKSVAN